ncbi:DUF2746 domain-containing protein [Salinispora pacifica]|uniref:DUF2746 domain-containing protein n=1 Tax=Salinispora pacifica TaxID=351187 RepID=UPI000366FBD3|nr:DUF2746 domain-containing protein [Salinispora pacifica]
MRPALALSLDPAVQAAIVTALGAIAVAFIGLLVDLLRRQHKHLAEVREHVTNAHDTNLRDDIDRVLAGLDQVIETQRQQGRDINGLRDDIRHERLERMDVARRLDQHMTG